MKRFSVVAALVCVACGMVGAARGLSDRSLAEWAKDVTADDAVERSEAVKALRDVGPAGMDALVAENAALIERGPRTSSGHHGPPDAAWERLTFALDHVGAARDSYAAGLYWYTDIEQAKAAAKAAGKPILSLRLLGNLDEELSCANSRYFRTVLYANKDVSKFLHDHYVLHWQSQRRVPRVTIDFGDGRKIERTITGNSVHYILTADGDVVDALPGLYGAGAFVRALQEAEVVARGSSTPAQRAAYAAGGVRQIESRWQADLAHLTGERPRAGLPEPRAQEAPEFDLLTVTKSGGERPILAQIFPAAEVRARSEAVGWEKIAAIHRKDAELDAGSLRLMRDKSPLMRAGGDASPMTAAFTDSVALDTVRNEYLMHREICVWLAGAARA
jgi:hypothetical protein